jgi:hypothetical protein
MTKVMPIDMNPKMLNCSRILRIFPSLRKWGIVVLKMIVIAIAARIVSALAFPLRD